MSDYDKQYEKQIKELDRHNKNVQRLVERKNLESQKWQDNFISSLESLKQAERVTPLIMSASDGMTIKHVTNRLRHMGLKDKICTMLGNVESSFDCGNDPKHPRSCDAVRSVTETFGCGI